MAAVICAAGPFTVFVGPVPLSLTSLAVSLASGAGGAAAGGTAAAVYILLGLAGAPVFAGFSGGAAVLAGPTGGYIIGYLPLAVLTGLFADKKPLFGIGLGMAALYALGCGWYMVYAQTALWQSLTVCVLPFLPLDAAKAAISAALIPRIRKALKKVESR